jgi:hypothetical protein
MRNIKTKIAAILATGGLALGTFVTTAFGATYVNVSGNGAFSDNTVSIRQNNRTDINQHNSARIDNLLDIRSNTGGNRANFNTGGDVFIRTGDVNTSVRISDNANLNDLYIRSLMKNNDRFTMLQANMTGEREVPGPGDPNGWGTAWVQVNPNEGRVCTTMHVYNIASATAAHIHRGLPGAAGPVVVTLPTPNANGFANGCVNADSDTLKNIGENPWQYYVNVHNNPYPDGAMRGQLSR